MKTPEQHKRECQTLLQVLIAQYEENPSDKNGLAILRYVRMFPTRVIFLTPSELKTLESLDNILTAA